MGLIQLISKRWSQLANKQRLAALILIVCLVAGMGLATYYIFVPRYVPLFTGLSPQQANAISEVMRQENIPFRWGAGGSSILVPQRQLHDIRIRLAGEGFYNNGIGFELFDQVNLGLTDFERRLNFQRALQEELRRTIVQFDEIEMARVHLVIPEQSLFQREARQATASVAIKLRPFASLRPEQVKSLVYLVSMSVPNLKPENVTVIDVAGNVLSNQLNLETDNLLGLTTRQMELKRAFEREMEGRLLAMLEQVFGPGKAVAMVSADLNFDQQTVTKIVYDGANAVVRSEHVVKEKMTTPVGEGGTPGVDGNIPTYPEDVGEGGESVYEREEHTRNWEIDSSETTIVYAPGKVERLSATITIDSDLTAAQVETLERMIAGAIGLEPERGDKLAVTGIAFNTEYFDRAHQDLSQIEERELIRQYMTYGLSALALLLGFILVLIIVKKLFALLGSQDIQVADSAAVLRHMDVHSLQAAAYSGKTGQGEMERIRELINNNPREVAEVIKAWAYES